MAFIGSATSDLSASVVVTGTVVGTVAFVEGMGYDVIGGFDDYEGGVDVEGQPPLAISGSCIANGVAVTGASGSLTASVGLLAGSIGRASATYSAVIANRAILAGTASMRLSTKALAIGRAIGKATSTQVARAVAVAKSLGMTGLALQSKTATLLGRAAGIAGITHHGRLSLVGKVVHHVGGLLSIISSVSMRGLNFIATSTDLYLVGKVSLLGKFGHALASLSIGASCMVSQLRASIAGIAITAKVIGIGVARTSSVGAITGALKAVGRASTLSAISMAAQAGNWIGRITAVAQAAVTARIRAVGRVVSKVDSFPTALVSVFRGPARVISSAAISLANRAIFHALTSGIVGIHLAGALIASGRLRAAASVAMTGALSFFEQARRFLTAPVRLLAAAWSQAITMRGTVAVDATEVEVTATALPVSLDGDPFAVTPVEIEPHATTHPVEFEDAS